MSKAPINWTNMLLFSLTPLFAVTLVPLYGFYSGYDFFEWGMFVLFMAFCGFSITAGYHRLWSHKAYRAHPLLRFVFALGGACALQNDVLTWASDHRRHHLHVDDNERDPYSAGRGFWFSHIGWILRRYESGLTDLNNVKDLQKDPILRWQRKHYLILVLIMNISVPVLIGWLHGDIVASLLLTGLLRLVLSQHVTYLINSLAHMWGRQPYNTTNSARDNGILALVTYGEGYHNYHHAFQWDYRNGIRWWHWDPTKWLIRGLSFIGLTHDLRRCNPARIEAARLEQQFRQATEKCDLLQLPEKWRQHLEHEYQEICRTLKLWNRHRQSWYQARSRNLQESLSQLDLLHIRDAYREVQYKLKVQRQRWEFILQNLANPAMAGT
ncbi:MAG: fatty acid desaturase [Gammaproteobacteria bacterium]|nr:fatty acid desaturase [Pseudomonadales bacterium]MCP5345660.1 fatty acid desaturase [Pseudomonadales bacterium]